MNTISNSTIEAIISRKEIIEFIESGEDTTDLVLISISEPISEDYPDGELTDEQVSKFKASLRVKFWDITENIGNYTVIPDDVALTIQQFIKENIDSRFIINCRAGQSRSAAVGKAIECIKFFGVGEEAKYEYRTSFNSEIDSHHRYYPNIKVFNKIVKDYT